jgi:hypothetical protein
MHRIILRYYSLGLRNAGPQAGAQDFIEMFGGKKHPSLKDG